MQPVVPLVERDRFVPHAVGSVLVDHHVEGACKTFWILVGQLPVVVYEQARVFGVGMEWLEILGVVREQNRFILATPAKELAVGRSLAESVLGMFYGVAPFSKHPLEGTTEVLVEEESNHLLDGFFGFQRRIPHSFERDFVLPFDLLYLVDVGVVLREGLVHFGQRDV